MLSFIRSRRKQYFTRAESLPLSPFIATLCYKKKLVLKTISLEHEWPPTSFLYFEKYFGEKKLKPRLNIKIDGSSHPRGLSTNKAFTDLKATNLSPPETLCILINMVPFVWCLMVVYFFSILYLLLKVVSEYFWVRFSTFISICRHSYIPTDLVCVSYLIFRILRNALRTSRKNLLSKPLPKLLTCVSKIMFVGNC